MGRRIAQHKASHAAKIAHKKQHHVGAAHSHKGTPGGYQQGVQHHGRQGKR